MYRPVAKDIGILEIDNVLPRGAKGIEKDTGEIRRIAGLASGWREETADPATTPGRFRKIMEALETANALSQKYPAITWAVKSELPPYETLDEPLDRACEASADLRSGVDLVLAEWAGLPEERARLLAEAVPEHAHTLARARDLADAGVFGDERRRALYGALPPSGTVKKGGDRPAGTGPELAASWADDVCSWTGRAARVIEGHGPERAREIAWDLPPGTISCLVGAARREGPAVFGEYLAYRSRTAGGKLTLGDVERPFTRGEGSPMAIATTVANITLEEFSPRLAELSKKVISSSSYTSTLASRRRIPPFTAAPGPGAIPLVMVSWGGFMSDAFSLGRELARAAHLLCASVRGSFGYLPSAPMGETGGCLGGILMFRDMRKKAEGPLALMSMTCTLLERVVVDGYLPLIMTAFELEAHRMAAEKADAKAVSDRFMSVHREMLGDSVAVRESDRWAWTERGRLFKAPYFDCAVPFGMFAAMSLVRGWEKGGRKFADRVVKALEMGSSVPAADIMAECGVSLLDENFWAAGIRWVGHLLKSL
ncbi:MAG: hypothetical protein LBT40_04560 [Deltaproteobacteria bacterium]|nr:hypothetical protein [Deltaproteobacteria bacterium]